MYLCGQSMLCTAPGCETANHAPSSNELVYEIYQSKGSNTNHLQFYRVEPDPCPLWASFTREVMSHFRFQHLPPLIHGQVTEVYGLGQNEEVIIKLEHLLQAAAFAEWERERKRGWETERARKHIHQAESINAQCLKRGAPLDAGGPHQRGGISGGRTSEEVLLFV